MNLSDLAGSDDPALIRRRPVIAIFTSHWLAMLGLGLVITAILGWIFLLSSSLRTGQENPYIGLAMIGTGVLLVLGLVLTPIGLVLGRRRLRQRVQVVGDGRGAWRRFLAFLLVVSLLNFVIASQATYRAVHTMESRDFCGSCHVMTPETRAFSQGAHASLLCVDCHVGDGARGFVASKVQGAKQLWSVITDSVHHPIQSAIEVGRIVPSAQTCESCHWKEKPSAVKLKLIQRYADDEENTPETTLLTMNVGGRLQGGIHGAHNGDGIEIDFVAADPRRQEILMVEYRDTKKGLVRTYTKSGVEPAQLAGKERIRMQCFDCHNRAAHTFLLPARAVDQAITLGRISATLPYVKREAVRILELEYATSEEAAQKIPAALTAYYASSHPEVASQRADELRAAGEVLADIYSRNVFPELKVGWGTYPDNRGHEDFPGCFRCHEGSHSTATGETITNNCFRCHFPAAVGDVEPEVLGTLGLDRVLKELQKH